MRALDRVIIGVDPHKLSVTMHRLFLGLLPGGAPVKKSVSQYHNAGHSPAP